MSRLAGHIFLISANRLGLQKLIDASDPSSSCMQPKAAGSCRRFIPSFFFDKHTGQCTSFTYTGCGGNSNNFKSEEECYIKCINNGLQDEVDTITVNSAAGIVS